MLKQKCPFWWTFSRCSKEKSEICGKDVCLVGASLKRMQEVCISKDAINEGFARHLLEIIL